ncbi:MAG: dihydrolipoamide acetyltransferase component of pyruvate dehydrogenase complex [Chloroflexota bacterium]|nr:MAG: dihydrolipoamide acetyltransferase component of pyruvate dehydrogenase complex [Chloroflexota bacterium]
MATVVTMPRLGNTVESSIIVRWIKQKGETVAEGEALCEVETDKATLEVPSPVSGTLLEMFFAEGDDVPVMTTIAAIGAPGENVESLRPGGAVSAVPAAAPAEPPAGRQPAAEQSSAPAAGAEVPVVGVSPRARSLAKQKGFDPVGLSGSGPGGRVIERDVLAALAARPRMTPLAQAMVSKGEFVAPPKGSGAGGRITSKDLSPAAAPLPAAMPQPGAEDEVEVVPVRGVRKVIAERMLASMQTTAQLTLNTSADARALLAYRKRLKNSPEALGLQKVTINDLVHFAVSRTLPLFRDLNALFEGDQISLYRAVNLGFAVDTPRGLIVPVIRRADRLSLRQLAAEASRLAAACQDGKASPDDLSGGTFTVTNLGSLGIESFTPVLNPPQVAILGVSSINLKPVEVDGQVEFVPHLGLSLTINHQVVDGAPAARFLQALGQNLAQLDVLLAL